MSSPTPAIPAPEQMTPACPVDGHRFPPITSPKTTITLRLACPSCETFWSLRIELVADRPQTGFRWHQLHWSPCLTTVG